MNGATGERAVSELLAAILVFGLVLFLIVLAQVSLVPTLNQQIEYEHSLRAQDDVRSLQSGVSRVAATGAGERYSVEAGVTYPNRPLLINPSSGARGTIETVEPKPGGPEITIEHLTTENPNTADYWEATAVADRGRYESRLLTHVPQYNEYRNAGRIVYENALLYRQFGSENVVTGAQSPLVSGRQIDLVALGGEFEDNSDGTVTVPVEPISAPSRSVSVTDDGQPITITIATRLTAAEWREILDGQLDTGSPGSPNPDDGRYVTDVQPGTESGTVTVTLEAGVTYDLRLAKVGVGEGNDREPAAYLTRDRGQAQVPVSGGEIAVSVRDRFNNPVSGTEVTFDVVDGAASLSAPTATSDADGFATTRITGADGVVRVRAQIDSAADADTTVGNNPWEVVEFRVQIGSGELDPLDQNELNPNREGVLVLEDAETTGQRQGTTKKCNGADCRVILTLNNRVGSEAEITAIRMNAYNPDGPGASNEAYPDGFQIDDTAVTLDPTTVELGAPASTVSGLSIAQDVSDYQLSLTFYQNGQVAKIPGGESFFLTITYCPDGAPCDNPRRTTYVVSPREATGGNNPGKNKAGGQGN